MGLIIAKSTSYSGPQDDVEFIALPGRNGELIQKNNRLNNYPISYECTIRHNRARWFTLREQMAAIKKWLYTKRGEYSKLTDSYNPEHFRNAVLTNAFLPERDASIYTVTIEFNCEPCLFRNDGDKSVTYLATNTEQDFEIINPTLNECYPLIEIISTSPSVAQSVFFSLNSEVWLVKNVLQKATIDSKKGKVYFDKTLLPYYVQVGSEYKSPKLMPVLQAKKNTLKLYGSDISNVSSIKLTPRWYEL